MDTAFTAGEGAATRAPDVEVPWAPQPALSGTRYSAAELSAAGDRVFLLDQRELPLREVYTTLRDADAVAEAIRAMVVRGAPAIGIAAAYGMALASRQAIAADEAGYRTAMREAGIVLAAARPTAVN